AVVQRLQSGFPRRDLCGGGRFERRRQGRLITSPGQGGGPLVNAFSGPSGVLIVSFNAYPPGTGPTSTGGVVRVGAVLVNSSGPADFLIGAGPGLAPEVKIFDFFSLKLVDDFFAYDQAFLGGIFVGGV